MRLFLILCAAISMGVLQTGYAFAVEPGDVAPRFELSELDGGYRESSSLFGSHGLTFLLFWESQCRHCVESLERAGRFDRDYGGGDIAVLGVNTDPGGLLSVVYRRKDGDIGSTPRALELAAPIVTDGSKSEGLSRGDGTVWYAFGVTPFEGVNRLLPASVLQMPRICRKIGLLCQSPSMAILRVVGAVCGLTASPPPMAGRPTATVRCRC